MMQKPELLAPAGGPEALVAAVENGADAVYLGGPMLNARISAVNFSKQQLAEAVHYAHLRGVKLYVTVNTLVADAEMESALNYLYDLLQMQVDAVILQDIGLAWQARQVLPELTLHASTQMTAHNALGVKHLLEAGFARVVLAREMSLGQIQHIKQSTGAQLEVFVHGALCVGYSGQCLLSSMIGGRSGNRGRCAQPCRMPYTCMDIQGKPFPIEGPWGHYLLSPRDLNGSEYLPELIQSGISSFKLEGRMKRPEYVATVVRIYRLLLDRAFANGLYQVEDEEQRELTQIFNREFTTGYFFGKQGKDMMSYQRPNNRGIKLGRVKGFGQNRMVEIALEQPLAKGDGLEVWVTEGGRLGFEVGEIWCNEKLVESASQGMNVKLVIPGRVRLGDRLFKTHDAQLMQKARSFTASGGLRKIPLIFTASAGVGEPFCLEVKDPEGHGAKACGEFLGEPAIKRPLDQHYLRTQLDRLGNTPFSIQELSCHINGDVIYPASQINAVRREVLAKLEAKRLAVYASSKPDIAAFQKRMQSFTQNRLQKKTKQKSKGMPLLSIAVGNMEGLQAAVESGADVVYWGSDSFRSQRAVDKAMLLKGREICKQAGVQFVFSTPRITMDQDLEEVAKQLQFFNPILPDGVLVGNAGVLALVQRTWPQMPLIADFGFNIFNGNAVQAMWEQGCQRMTLSTELTMEQIKNLTIFPVEVLVQGALELMISEYCLPGCLLGGLAQQHGCSEACKGKHLGLRDRTGVIFPLETDTFCRMHVFNSKDLCLLEDIDALQELGVFCFRIEARRESAMYVRKTVKSYRAVLDAGAKSLRQQLSAQYKEQLAKLNPDGITKGHLYRGITEIKERLKSASGKNKTFGR